MYFGYDRPIPGEARAIKDGFSPTERKRLKKCKEYHSSIKHTYLSLDDVKCINGGKMFIAVIDFDDSKIFREKYSYIKKDTLFPKTSIIGNINGNVYDFSDYFYLNLDKYMINYARCFSSIVTDDYWDFFYNDVKKRVELTFNSQSSGCGLGQLFVLDKFASVRLGIGLDCYDLYDKDALDKVLRKERK